MQYLKAFFKPSPKKGYVETVAPPPQLILAIEYRKIITFNYDGEEYPRTVEPHACGVLGNGRTVLIGYQLSGLRKSEADSQWRTFCVEKIASLGVTDKTFAQNRPDYNPHDKSLNPVYAKV